MSESGNLSQILNLIEISKYALFFEFVGVLYYSILFYNFGLNYADFATLQDFLLSSFKEPLVFFLSLISVLYVAFSENKTTNYLARCLITIPPIVFAIFTAIVCNYWVENKYQTFPLSNTGQLVEVWLQQSANFNGMEQDRKLDTVRLIGKVVGNYIFFDKLMSEPTNRTIIIPETEIIQIRISQSQR